MLNKRAVLATGLEAADLNISFSSLMMEMDTLFLCTVVLSKPRSIFEIPTKIENVTPKDAYAVELWVNHGYCFKKDT